MKKNIVALVIIVILTIIFLPKRNTEIFTSLTGYSPHDEVDMHIFIDKKSVFSDTVVYTAFTPRSITLPMRFGFHQITVESKSLNIKKEKRIFLFFNQYILVEFYNELKFIRNEPEFKISVMFNPFYIE